MTWNFEEIKQKAQREILEISSPQDLEAYRVKYLGRKGLIQEIYSSLAALPADQKPTVGKSANDLRNLLNQLMDETKARLEQSEQQKQTPADFDPTLPGVSHPLGHLHILTQTISEVCGIFERLGFMIYEGPEVESEFHNFTALNIPVDHPSRDAFDTFYLETSDPDHAGRHLLLRSHTSPGQIRILKETHPPLAVVIPGKVYRPDAVDASHSFMFHQIEGLLVDEDVKFSHLKALLSIFCQRLFGEHIKTRFRPHFFPFTEPSAEMDISCYICQGRGCSVCGRKGWLEILGCGMVHPKVFEAAHFPKGKYSGLAFGMGVERMAMLKHRIHDIRLFFENDVRFLKQF